MSDRNYSPAYGPAKGLNPPLCTNCSNPVRNEGYKTVCTFPPIFSCPPWNSGWDGKCEHCGFDFNTSFVQVLRKHPDENKVESGRNTKISVASTRFPVFYDESEILSGVEIEITSFGRYFQENSEKIFISTNELKYILSTLINSPILQQFDWGEDWT